MPKPLTEFLLVEATEFTEFEWDEDKRALNWEVHEIDFDDAKTIFLGPHICVPSNRKSEERWLAVGLLENVEISVVFTLR